MTSQTALEGRASTKRKSTETQRYNMGVSSDLLSLLASVLHHLQLVQQALQPVVLEPRQSAPTHPHPNMKHIPTQIQRSNHKSKRVSLARTVRG